MSRKNNTVTSIYFLFSSIILPAETTNSPYPCPYGSWQMGPSPPSSSSFRISGAILITSLLVNPCVLVEQLLLQKMGSLHLSFNSLAVGHPMPSLYTFKKALCSFKHSPAISNLKFLPSFVFLLSLHFFFVLLLFFYSNLLILFLLNFIFLFFSYPLFTFYGLSFLIFLLLTSFFIG